MSTRVGQREERTAAFLIGLIKLVLCRVIEFVLELYLIDVVSLLQALCTRLDVLVEFLEVRSGCCTPREVQHYR